MIKRRSARLLLGSAPQDSRDTSAWKGDKQGVKGQPFPHATTHFPSLPPNTSQVSALQGWCENTFAEWEKQAAMVTLLPFPGNNTFHSSALFPQAKADAEYWHPNQPLCQHTSCITNPVSQLGHEMKEYIHKLLLGWLSWIAISLILVNSTVSDVLLLLNSYL